MNEELRELRKKQAEERAPLYHKVLIKLRELGATADEEMEAFRVLMCLFSPEMMPNTLLKVAIRTEQIELYKVAIRTKQMELGEKAIERIMNVLNSDGVTLDNAFNEIVKQENIVSNKMVEYLTKFANKEVKEEHGFSAGGFSRK